MVQAPDPLGGAPLAVQPLGAAPKAAMSEGVRNAQRPYKHGRNMVILTIQNDGFTMFKHLEWWFYHEKLWFDH